MSQGVYITRQVVCAEGSEKPIGLEEWLKVVAKHPDLKLAKVATHPLPDGRLLEMKLGEGGALWFGHPEVHQGIALIWSKGRVRVEARGGPDVHLLRLLKTLAAELDARVVGEGDEEY